MQTIYNIYEGILNDIDNTLDRTDKSVERLSIGMPEYDECKTLNGHWAVCYVWKLPAKILNIIKADRDRMLSNYEWLTNYDKTADNIVVYCSARKFYINLCTDHTIAGIRLIGGTPGSAIYRNFCHRTYETNQNNAFKILSSLADINNLKYLFKHGGPESHSNHEDILNKLVG